jgi:hypothetical protein
LEEGPGIHDVDGLLPCPEDEPREDTSRDQDGGESQEEERNVPCIAATTPISGNVQPPPAFGTPTSKDYQISRALEGEGIGFRFAGRSNRLNAEKARARRLTFDTPEHPVPHEPPSKGGTWKWNNRIPRMFKFVDDGTFGKCL